MKSTSGSLGSSALLMALAFSAQANTSPAPAPCTSSNVANEECSPGQSKEVELVEVNGMRLSPYRAQRSGDQRRLADLADLPQTMTVLTQRQILEAGQSDLKEVLSNQAGVTLGTGENGNAFGDRYIIRGHEARSDVFVDGLRDPGMTTRESFASEQVEITKGPSATFAGRGSSGGAVNSITKQASPDFDFNRLEAGIGKDDYHRVVVDSNIAINDDNAVRVNLLHADETVPDRDGIERSRRGILLSGYTAPTEKLHFIADVYSLSADDVPDLGSYFDRDSRTVNKTIPVYAQREDFLDSEVLSATLRTHYTINDDWRFYNATRWGKTDNGYVTTGARGTARDASDAIAPGASTFVMSTHQGWQEVDYVATQFNLFWDTKLGNLPSKWVFGAEFSDESVDNGVYNINYLGSPNCMVAGRAGVSASYCGLDENGTSVANIRDLMQREISRGDKDSQSDIETLSWYAMNSLSLSDSLELFVGFRWDSFDYNNNVVSRGEEALFSYSDDLYNGHVGLVYDVADNGNVYLTYSTATNINGGESDLGANCGYGGLCGDPDQVGLSDPEQVENIELGTKWELFDERLLATAALFQITKSDVMESVGDAYSTLGTLNTGKNRVKGVEVSLSGAITDALSVQLSATKMDAEVLASINSDTVGLTLSNFADESLYAQLRYELNDSFAFGASATYQSDMFGGQPDTAADYSATTGQYSIVVPSYTVIDVFANYYYSEELNFRLNIGNVTDKEYWTAAYRSGAFMYLGEAQSVRASVTYKF